MESVFEPKLKPYVTYTRIPNLFPGKYFPIEAGKFRPGARVQLHLHACMNENHMFELTRIKNSNALVVGGLAWKIH